MLSPQLKKQPTRHKGMGIFATSDIPRGAITCFECAQCKRFTSLEELSGLDAHSRAHVIEYAYEKGDGSLLFPCDDVIYINHSCNSNTLGTPFGFDIAIRDIPTGNEVTFDYRMFYERRFRSEDYYTEFRCCCGEECCDVQIRLISPEHQPASDLVRRWHDDIESSLPLVRGVQQPLWNDKERTLIDAILKSTSKTC